MSDTAMVRRKPEDRPPERRPLVDEQLADQLLGKAAAEGVELLGPDGLLSQPRVPCLPAPDNRPVSCLVPRRSGGPPSC
jgi:hypothetical protein